MHKSKTVEALPPSLEKHLQSILEAMKVRRYSKSTLEGRGWALRRFLGHLVSLGVEDMNASFH